MTPEDLAYFKDRLMRAGALHDAQRADLFLFDRVDRETRRAVIDALFPEIYDAPTKWVNPDRHPDDLESMGFPEVGKTSPHIVNLYLEEGTDFIQGFFDVEKHSPEHMELCKALLPAYVTACATVHAAWPQTLTMKGSYR